MRVRKALPSELTWANDRYAEINFVRSSELDFIAVAEIDGVRVGLGRVVTVDRGVGELGGMYVLSEYRGHAVATYIVEFLLLNCDSSSLFCIPFAPLEMFYRRFGFQPMDLSIDVPQAVSDKVRWCEVTYDAPVVLLHRIT